MPTRQERAAKSRENGRKGGRRARKSADERMLRQFIEHGLNLDMEDNVKFLQELRDGIVLGATVADRRQAAVNLLEAAPAIVRMRAEIAAQRDQTAGEAAQRSVKRIVETNYQPPEGWSPEAPKSGELGDADLDTEADAPLEFDDDVGAVDREQDEAEMESDDDEEEDDEEAQE